MYALIGNPLGHSFSANFFNEKFRREHIDNRYILAQLDDISDVTLLLEDHPDLQGFNVTIPYKQQIIPYLDSLSDEAREIGAVNVVKVEHRDGKRYLKGFNSDAIGFRESIAPLIKPDMKRALILGTGGASHAVDYVLRSLGIETVKVSRTKSEDRLTYADLTEDVMRSHLVIVNTTPLGTWPNTEACPDIPYDFITPGHLCFDLVYNPETTTFMKKAAEHGATVKNGLEMLHLQAIGAWKIWNSDE